ncbi:hypothetical protein ACFOQM_00420 [Paenibacillus sp. GCM10012307]|uniref:hypothetical protein n=1 Tax=Paenibacillus sp. GCM10012307 TaxID=3317343 RepID=UPI00360669CB
MACLSQSIPVHSGARSDRRTIFSPQQPACNHQWWCCFCGGEKVVQRSAAFAFAPEWLPLASRFLFIRGQEAIGGRSFLRSNLPATINGGAAFAEGKRSSREAQRSHLPPNGFL